MNSLPASMWLPMTACLLLASGCTTEKWNKGDSDVTVDTGADPIEDASTEIPPDVPLDSSPDSGDMTDSLHDPGLDTVDGVVPDSVDAGSEADAVVDPDDPGDTIPGVYRMSGPLEDCTTECATVGMSCGGHGTVGLDCGEHTSSTTCMTPGYWIYSTEYYTCLNSYGGVDACTTDDMFYLRYCCHCI